ncbi:hypothetical protein [Streptomyces lateritius]|uniref:hypothetical protein n=1 Tax=Streptomyces lateritius TaxID=67313 RepID=UPI001E5F042A|nr:hypothetical protein [Streptomyces lateritius]
MRLRVVEARDATHDFLNALEPAPAPPAADSVVLVVSELVTNALRDAGSECSLHLTAHPGTLTVTVTDLRPNPPRTRTPT